MNKKNYLLFGYPAFLLEKMKIPSIKVFLFIIAFLIFNACDKFDEDAVLTEGEKISNEIQNVTKTNKFSYCNINLITSGNWYKEKNNQPFSLNGQFIIVEGKYYNLNDLYKFEIINLDYKVIDLYFK